MDALEHQHPVLGTVQWDDVSESWEATVQLRPSAVIQFAVVPASESPQLADPVFSDAVDFLAWARGAEPEIRNRVAADLLGTARCSVERGPDGGEQPVERDWLVTALRPSTISLYPGGDSCWYYECADLFAGQRAWLLMGADRVVKRSASLI